MLWVFIALLALVRVFQFLFEAIWIYASLIMMQLKHIQNHCFAYYLDVFFINLARLSLFFTALKPKSLQWLKWFYAPWPLQSYHPGFFLPSPQLQLTWPLLFLWKCQTSSCLSTCAFAVCTWDAFPLKYPHDHSITSFWAFSKYQLLEKKSLLWLFYL